MVEGRWGTGGGRREAGRGRQGRAGGEEKKEGGSEKAVGEGGGRGKQAFITLLLLLIIIPSLTISYFAHMLICLLIFHFSPFFLNLLLLLFFLTILPLIIISPLLLNIWWLCDIVEEQGIPHLPRDREASSDHANLPWRPSHLVARPCPVGPTPARPPGSYLLEVTHNILSVGLN